MPGLEQTNHALIFQIAADELGRGLPPGNPWFHVGGQLESVGHCVGMLPAEDECWDQGKPVSEPDFDYSQQTIAIDGKEEQTKRKKRSEDAPAEIAVSEDAESSGE